VHFITAQTQQISTLLQRHFSSYLRLFYPLFISYLTLCAVRVAIEFRLVKFEYGKIRTYVASFTNCTPAASYAEYKNDFTEMILCFSVGFKTSSLIKY